MYTGFCILFAILIIAEIITISCHFECKNFDVGGIVAIVCLILQAIFGVITLFYDKLMFVTSIFIVVLIAPFFIFIFSDKAVEWLKGLWNKKKDGTKTNKTKKPLSKGFKVIVWLIIIAAFLVFCGWVFDRSKTLVKLGERGVKTVAGKVIPKTYNPGIVTNLPFCKRWGFNVIVVETRPQRYQYDNVVVRTKELQQVILDCSILLQLTPDSIHVLYDKYTGYEDYEKNVVQDLVKTTMLALSSQMSFWSFAEETSHLMTEAVNYIVNDQLMAENLAKVKTFRLLSYQASPEVESLIEKTIQARQGIELERLKLEKAKVETERVKQEAVQTYERLAATARANGIDVQIKANALRNPFVAQYEVAKALQNWKGEVTLPNTLAIMEQASNGGGGTSIFPIVPITTGK